MNSNAPGGAFVCFNYVNLLINICKIHFNNNSLFFKVDHICEIFSFVLKGLPLLVIDPVLLSTSLNDLIDFFDKFKVTYFVLVPSLLKNILLYSKAKECFQKLNSVKRWVVSGEQLTIDLVLSFFDITSHLSTSPVLSNFYGSTEVTADVTFITFTSREQMLTTIHNNSNVPIGYPISNSRIYLMDENLNLIQNENTIGEIYAAGSCLAKGYLNDIDGSSNKFIIWNNERLFKTGDFGLFKYNTLYFTGRQDAQLKISGKRIDLNELEFYAIQMKGIQSFVPLVYEHSQTEKHIIAFYKFSNLTELSTELITKNLLDHLKSCVFDYMIPNPNNLIRLESIPLLYNGKVDKQALKKIFKENYSKQSKPLLAPATNNLITVQDKVLELVENITGITINRKTADQNIKFQELGINSLNSVEIYLAVNKLINNKISFEQFISIKTLNELISKISALAVVVANDSQCETSSHLYKPAVKCDLDIFKCVNLNFEKMSHLRSFRFSEDPKYSFLVLEMIADTFPKKNILHSTYPMESSKQNLFDFILPSAEYLQNSNTSFIVFDAKKNKFVGGSFLYDYYNTHLPCNTDNEYFLNLLKMLSTNRKMVSDRPNLKNKKLLNASFMTTNLEASTSENIILINFIEDQIIKIANENNYDAIITINTTKLTKVCNFLNNLFLKMNSNCI